MGPARLMGQAGRPLRRIWRFTLIAAVLAMGLPDARAQLSLPGFNGFKHTRWTADDGAPTGIRDIAQTPDGYLWLASAKGLYRFDGVAFDRVAAPAGSAMENAAPASFLLTPAGELWIGYSQSAGVAVYRGGRLQDTHMAGPPIVITEMTQTPDGAIWAATADIGNRLHRFAKGRWEEVDGKLALPAGGISALQATRDGRLWIFISRLDNARSGGLFYLPPGGTRFLAAGGGFSGFPRSVLDGHGNLWVSDAKGTRLLLGPDGQPQKNAALIPPIPGQRFATLAFDRAGGIWGTTGTAGIFYSPGGGRLARYRAADGLTSDIAIAVFVDREQNIWIGGASGLDQFRLASVKREPLIPIDPIDGHLISAADDGKVYIASLGMIYLIEPGKAPRAIARTGNDLYSTCPARLGGIWAVRVSGIVRISGADRQVVAVPRGGARAMTCAEDRGGRLWLGFATGELSWRDARGWHKFNSAALNGPRVEELVATPTGDIALRTVTGAAWLIDTDRLAARRLPIGGTRALSMIASGSDAVFISGAEGLWRMRGSKVQLIDRRRYPWVAQLRAVVQAANGETWLLGGDGLSRVATADLDRAFDTPDTPLTRRLFDARDGWTSTTQQIFFVGPQGAAGGDGRVWFVDRDGAVYIEPANLPRNRLPPAVLVRGLTSAGQIFRDPRAVTLAAGTRSLEIAYTATSLVVPHRVRFRYRLEGVDDGWVDPGTRRLASYANLGPGRYRFRVIAANDDGVWNTEGATLAIEILPTVFESWPFKLFCGMVAAAVAWLAYTLRLRAVTDRIRTRIAERTDERERIARELHDTLLQSVQALTLRFQLAIDYLPREEPARPVLEAAIDQADQVIAEGRDRVRDLRMIEDGDLEQILRDIVARQTFDPGVDIVIQSSRAPRPLDPLARDEIVRIANEAIFNIARHAEASHVEIMLDYGKRFTIRFADNGVGIHPEIASRGEREGHFGLPGMRERARKLRGDLAIVARPGGGTELLLTVPGRIAYKTRKRRLLARIRSLGDVR